MFVKLIIVVVAVYLLFKFLKNSASRRPERSGYGRVQKPVGGEDLVEDPVCRTYIPVSSAVKAVVDGKTVYFCSQKCLDAYEQETMQQGRAR
jgi:YHS domain-containing protein